MTEDRSQAEILRSLRQICRGLARPISSDSSQCFSMGIPSLDNLLPNGGIECGSLVEWLSPVEGCGAAVIALQGVRVVVDRSLVWAVVDAVGDFHPAPVCGWGISLESLLLVRPKSVSDALWAVEQCLRCPGIGITWFIASFSSSWRLPDRVLRRWKIAAESGKGLGILFRPLQSSQNASWADVRWKLQAIDGSRMGDRYQAQKDRVKNQSARSNGGLRVTDDWQANSCQANDWPAKRCRRVRVELLACRGIFPGASVELDVNDATGDVS
ncbi:MAG: hypothetical protein FJ267_11180, partial [Planctomycetes bacterium]|nr:hypothetical protein [Planctomycetota bacterium]